MKKRTAIPLLVTALLCCLTLAACKRGGGTAKAMTDFSTLSTVDGKAFSEGIGTLRPFLSRLKNLTGDAYPTIIAYMKEGNPEGMLLDGLWYTLNADFGEGNNRKQATIVADLPKNNLAAGYWKEGMGAPKYFIEQKEKMAPPFQAWLEDWD
jgi:hypothetical protein